MAETTNLFIIGRPGSGKTTAATYIREHLVQPHVYIEAHQVAVELFHDNAYRKKFSYASKGDKENTLRFRDASVYEDILRRIEEKALAASDTIVTIIEFAHPSYRKAFERFSAELITRSCVLIVYADYDSCITRVAARFNAGEGHAVSPAVMESGFSDDTLQSLDVLGRRFRIPSERIRQICNFGTKEDLYWGTRKACIDLFKPLRAENSGLLAKHHPVVRPDIILS